MYTRKTPLWFDCHQEACRGLSCVSWFKLASLVHGGGWQELESLLDFGRVGVEEGGEGLEFGGKIECAWCGEYLPLMPGLCPLRLQVCQSQSYRCGSAIPFLFIRPV